MCGLPPCTTTTKLQLKYRTTITQNHQKIELCGSPTTKKLKRPYSSRQQGGWRGGDMEMRNWFQTHMWWIKMKGYLWIEGYYSHTRPPSTGFQYQENKSPKLMAVKTSGVVSVETLLGSQVSPLIWPHTAHRLSQTHPALGSSTGAAA